MFKIIFEEFGGTYAQQDNYRLQNLTLPAEKEKLIGVWSQHHQRYLKQHQKVQYYNSALPIQKNKHSNFFLGR